jgi:hypothetical protein
MRQKFSQPKFEELTEEQELISLHKNRVGVIVVRGSVGAYLPASSAKMFDLDSSLSPRIGLKNEILAKSVSLKPAYLKFIWALLRCGGIH